MLPDIKIIPLLDTLRIQKIPDKEYFSDTYSEYISNSRLSLLKSDGPEAFFEGLSKHNKYSDSLTLGSCVHELVLQPELFNLSMFVFKPSAKMGYMADELYNAYLENKINNDTIISASNKIGYYKDKMNEAKIQAVIDACTPYWIQRSEYEKTLIDSDITTIYLDKKSVDKVLNCVTALQNNQYIQELLHPRGLITDPISENEQAILLDVEIHAPNHTPFIFKLKAKLDNYTIDFESNTLIVNDVKTIGKILPEFENNFNTYAYYRELSIYSWLLSLVAKKFYNMKNGSIKSNCLVVSTIPNYYTKVYKVTKSDFNRGWNEFLSLLRLAAKFYIDGYRFK